MSKELYKKLLSELASVLDLEDLAPDEDDYCCLGFDDSIIVHFQYNDEIGALMLFSQVGTVEEQYAAEIYPKLLHANLFWQGTGGATLGIDEDTQEVILCYQTPIKDLDVKQFEDLIEGFVNTSELWIETLTAVTKED